MSVRTTVELPEPLHEALRRRAEESGASIDALILRTLEAAYGNRERVSEPPVKVRGKLGPHFPVDENPYDVVFP
jgi:hypothetical protein